METRPTADLAPGSPANTGRQRKKRALNTPLLVGTLVAAAVLVPAVYGWHAYQVRRIASSFLDRADRFEKEKKWQEAAGYLYSYRRLHPEDAEVQARLARTFDKAATEPRRKLRAIELYYQALGVAPADQGYSLRCRLTELLLEVRRFVPAEQEVRRLLAENKNDPEATRLLALALDGQLRSGALAGTQRDAALVVESLETALAAKENRGNVPLSTALALVYRNTTQLPDDELAGILATLYGPKGKPGHDSASGIRTRVGRADSAPLPAELAPILAEVDPQAATASGNRLTALLTAMYGKEKKPPRNRVRTVVTAVRAALADDVMDQLVVENPEAPESFLARYRYRLDNGLPGAKEDLETALKHGPSNAAAHLAAADSARREADAIANRGGSVETMRPTYSKAQDHYRRALEAEPSLEAAHLGLGWALAGLGEFDGAVDAWRHGLKQCGETNLSLNLALAQFFIRHDRLDEAGRHLQILEEQTRRLTPYANRSTLLSLERSSGLLRGEWRVRKGEFAAAIPSLRLATQDEAGTRDGATMAGNAYVSLAAAYGALQQPEQMALNYEKAADLQPAAVQLRLNAAATWLTAGRPDLAMGQYERALALGDTAEVRFGLARTHLLRQLSLPKAQRNWGQVESALEEAKKPDRLKNFADAWRIPLLEAQYLATRSREEAASEGTGTAAGGSAQRAKEVLNEAEKTYPKSAGLFRSLVLFYDGLGYPEQADHALAEFEKLATDPADVCLLRCTLSRRRGLYGEARKTLQHGLDSLPPASVPAMRIQMAEISMDEGKIQQASRELEGVIQNSGNVVGAVGSLRRLAELALQTGDLAELEKIEPKLQELEGVDGCYWRYYRARRLMSQMKGQADLDEATELERQITSRRPAWSSASFLAGMVLEHQGKYKQASEKYQEAIRLGERGLSVYERLIRVAYGMQRFDEADRYLSQLRQQGLSSQDMAPLESRIAAGLALTSPDAPTETRRTQLRRSLDAARLSVTQRPEDPLGHMWLGNLLLVSSEESPGAEASKQKLEAEAEFREAVKRAPTDVRTYEALFGYYRHGGQQSLAEKTIQEVEQTKSLSPHERTFLLGRMHERLGQADTAERDYREAVNLVQATATGQPSPKIVAFKVAVLRRLAALLLRNSPEKASDVYREICTLLPNSDSDRRLLASALALRSAGKYDPEAERLWQEAEGLLKDANSESANSTLDLRLRAALLFQRGGVENLKRAQELFDRLVAKPEEATDFDRLNLARIHAAQAATFRAAGDEVKAKGELNEARRHYTSLVARDKPDPSHLVSYVELLLRNDLSNEAAPWQRKLNELAAGNPEILVAYTALLLRHGRAEAAPLLDQLEKLAPNDLRTTELRARWLETRGETAKIEPLVEPAATRLLEKAGKNEKEGAQVCLGVGALYASVKQYDLAARWYRRVVAMLPEEYESLAISLAKQGQTKEALQICSEAAKRENSARAVVAMASVLAYGKPDPADFQLAEPTLAQAAQRHKDDAEVLVAVANARFVEKRINDAVGLYRQVLKLQPKNVLVLNNLATLLMEQPGSRDEALRCINQAIDVAGPRPPLLDTKGTALLYDGKPKEAVPCLEEAIRGTNSDPRFHLHLAVAYDRLGETEKARRALQEAQNAALSDEILTGGDQKLLDEVKQKLNR